MASYYAKKLAKMMDTYEEEFAPYTAPYTSLGTSSMMGKSRLMKEMSHHIPCVYICLRTDYRKGYPPRTPHIGDWFERPLTSFDIGYESYWSDREHELPVLKFAAFLLSLVDRLNTLASRVDQLADIMEIDLGWMWQFFADENESAWGEELGETQETFWDQVMQDATKIIVNDVKSPSRFIKQIYTAKMGEAYDQLKSTFSRWTHGDFTLVLLFDEARSLCELSSYDGKPLLDDTFYKDDGSRILEFNSRQTRFPFSNFRALRQALRYLLYCRGVGNGVYPRLFGLFTDTASRLLDFQPHPAMDRSSRTYSQYPPGKVQFDPIYAFTSIDAYARKDCNGPCLSDANLVADPNRLIKFGRAGWNAMLEGRVPTGRVPADQFFNSTDTVRLIALHKLLCTPHSVLDLKTLSKLAEERSSPTLNLKFFALLAVRLNISAGPFTVEAGELIASHLAVLVGSNSDRTFLKTTYPSEPILATVAAEGLEVIGWGRPLMVLCNYVNSSIVDAGFRGELLTKVVCLMAMDNALRSLKGSYQLPQSSQSPKLKDSQPKPQPSIVLSPTNPPSKLGRVQSPQADRPQSPSDKLWVYSKPLKVYQYLDHLLEPPDGYETFSSALIAEPLNIDSKKLSEFLEGYVFFNHFNQSYIKLSMDLMARAWNRGAALVCKPYSESIDFCIPVMLAQPGTQTRFGPMFGPWNSEEIENACEHMSFILINSKNHHHDMDNEADARNITPKPSNFRDKWTFDKKGKVYLSILQDFGPSADAWKGSKRVEILSPSRHSTNRPRQQIVVVVKGYDGDTYKCLADFPDVQETDPRYHDRKLTQDSFKQLKERVELEDRGDDDDNQENVAIKDGFYNWGEVGTKWQAQWNAPKRAEDHEDEEMVDATMGRQGLSILGEEESEQDDEGDRMSINAVY